MALHRMFRAICAAGLITNRIELETSAMNLIKRISAASLAVMLAAAMGCSTAQTQETPGEYVSDAWITTKVKAMLVEDSQVKATEVNVETHKGTVQLTGFVGTEAAMIQAVRIAHTVKGVNSVKNDMRLK